MIDVKGYATSHSINPADGKPIPNMQLSGSNLPQGIGIPTQGINKIEVETFINAMSVPAGGTTGNIKATFKGESLTFYGVTIDQSSYDFYTLSPYSTGYGKGSYPVGSSISGSVAPSNPGQPKIFLQTFNLFIDSESAPSNWNDASFLSASYEDQGVRVNNNGTAPATVSVRIIRVWR